MLLRYLKGNESESKSQRLLLLSLVAVCCCVTSKVMNLKANHNEPTRLVRNRLAVALPQR